MAEHGTLELGPGTGADYGDRQRMYRSFLRIVRYSLIGIAIILVILAWVHGQS